jgi:hypothetical protein
VLHPVRDSLYGEEKVGVGGARNERDHVKAPSVSLSSTR